MRSMETLIDANHALSKDLPLAYLRRRHWLEAGNLLVEAATTGEDIDVERATEKLLFAVEREGWMERPVLIPETSRSADEEVPQEYIPRRRAAAEGLSDKPFPGPRLRLLERAVPNSAAEVGGRVFASKPNRDGSTCSPANADFLHWPTTVGRY
ncbi:MAG TPA: hypothetical protein VK148_23470 [Xanthobacteraceae bacterium]|nr:hypothetical protein [Xanthobacteraceae bacterium]